MGIGSSIAHSSRKYRTNEELPHSQRSRHSAIEAEDDNEDDLASVSSFRPTSPFAHQGARAFRFDSTYGKPPEPRRRVNRHSYYSDFELGRYPANGYPGNGYPGNGYPGNGYPGNRHSYQGSLERGSQAGNDSRSTYSLAREPGSKALITQSSSSIYAPVRTMRDVREYLMSNPELLANKKKKAVRQPVESDLYGLSNNRKQMKTKQSVYMGLINAPVIYGMGARPDDRQLKVDQKLYLNLVYPTMRAKDYHNQAIRSRPPLKHEGMVVVRKDDYLRQPNGYIRRPPPQMQVSRVHESPMVKSVPEPTPHERTISAASQKSRGLPQNSNKTALKRGSNGYVDFPDIVHEPLTSRSVKSERQTARYRQMNGFVKHEHSPQKTARQFRDKENDEVVFTFNVDDLDLKKKSGKDTDQVVPLYFRKSLAYSPKYEYSEDLLSSPL